MSELQPLDWADRPATKPMAIILEQSEQRKRIELHIGNCAVALFRKRPEMDYFAVMQEKVLDGGEIEQEWTYVFGRREMAVWMGGVALTSADHRMLRLANRANGSFASRHGFNFDVVVEDYPSHIEVESYLDYLMREPDLHKDLLDSQTEDFEA